MIRFLHLLSHSCQLFNIQCLPIFFLDPLALDATNHVLNFISPLKLCITSLLFIIANEPPTSLIQQSMEYTVVGSSMIERVIVGSVVMGRGTGFKSDIFWKAL